LPTAISTRNKALLAGLTSSRGFALLDEVATSRAAFLATTTLFALALRLAVVAFVFRTVAAPTANHNEFGWEMGWTARSIVLGRGFSSPFLPFTGPTALVPPLYPYLIAAVEKLFGLYTAKSAFVILSINSLLSALTAIPVYFSTRLVTRERVARAAALVWAVYPFSVYFSADRVWDYALTGFLLTLCFWWSQRLHRRGTGAWASFGALCGVATLSNPSVLLVLAPAALIALYRRGRAEELWLKSGACAALAGLLVCMPWVVRNQRTFHHPTFIRDGFWLEFWAGNNGDTFESNPAWAHPASNPVEMQRYEAVTEPEYMAEKRDLSLHFVERYPGFFVKASMRRAFFLWTGLWSLDKKYIAKDPTEIPDFFYCATVSLLAFWGARRWWKADRVASLPYIAAIVLFPITYYITHSSPDYRQPIEPIIVVLSVVGVMGPSIGDDYTLDVDESLDEEANDERVAMAI
jgi:4-amino-4-deoxy-L-arabinose transferase-like glycosyltransferase